MKNKQAAFKEVKPMTSSSATLQLSYGVIPESWAHKRFLVTVDQLKCVFSGLEFFVWSGKIGSRVRNWDNDDLFYECFSHSFIYWARPIKSSIPALDRTWLRDTLCKLKMGHQANRTVTNGDKKTRKPLFPF